MVIFDRGGRPTLRPGERSEPVTILMPASEVAAWRREAAERGLPLSALVRERCAPLEAVATCTLCGGDSRIGDRPCGRCYGHGVLYARPA